MTRETPSPPPGRSARRSFSERGPDNDRDPQASPRPKSKRELSPWSARRVMTHAMTKMDIAPVRRRSRDRSQEKRPANGAHRQREAPSRSRSREPKSREPRDGAKARKVTGPMEDASPATRSRRDASGSPEPYRKPRERSRDRKRARSRDRHGHRDRSKERHRDRERETGRNRSRDAKRGHTKDRYRERSRSQDQKQDRKRRDRSASPQRSHRKRNRSRSRSRDSKRRRRSPSSPHERSRKPLPSQEVSFRGTDNSAQAPTKYGGAPPTREKPNFKTTGLLAKEANKVEGTKISLKYHEPPEARKPPTSSQWRLWMFKGADTLGTFELFMQSCWLLGRAKEVADILLEHPSTSGQHAAIQFRHIQKTAEDEYGVREQTGKVKPYIIDLESSNGTELNGEELEAGRYYELRDKDILKFGVSEREYMMMLPPEE